MRVLCLDLMGVLNGLPSPALLPEFGQKFFHLSHLNDEKSLVEFMHVGDRAESKEIWCLWRAGKDRYVLESSTKRLIERLGAVRDVPVTHLLIEQVSSGAEYANFFDPNRAVAELRFCAQAEPSNANWRTVLLGVHGQGSALSSGQEELVLGLLLRFWMGRFGHSDIWPEKAYRILFSLRDQQNNLPIEGIFQDLSEIWASTFLRLREEAKRERERYCKGEYLLPPGVIQVAFPNRPKKWPSLCRWLVGKGDKLGWFYKAEDVGRARNWVAAVFGKLTQTMEQLGAEAQQAFEVERASLFDGKPERCSVLEKTPSQAVADFQSELKNTDKQVRKVSARASIAKTIVNAQQDSLARLLGAVRVRPMLSWVMSAVVLTTVALAVIFSIRTPLPPQFGLLPGWSWYLFGAILISLAVVWGLYWCRRETTSVIEQVEDKVNSLWQEIEGNFQEERNLLDLRLKRIVLAKNLELAEQEMQASNRRMAQIEFHLNTLKSYFGRYLGSDIELKKVDLSRAYFDEASWIGANPVYLWSHTGTSPTITGFVQKGVPIGTKHLNDPRLAGLTSIQVECISPMGRQLEQNENSGSGLGIDGGGA